MELDDLLRELRQSATSHDLNQVANPDDLAVTEAALNQRLPQSFRTFVCEFSNGAYLFGTQEVSSVGSAEHPLPIHKNEWHYGSAAQADPDELIPIREGGAALYRSLIPFSLDSNGNEWCFIIDAAKPEPQVAYFSSPLAHEPKERRLYAPLSGGFSEWLEILVTRRPTDEVIRTIYVDDEGVLYDELMLGSLLTFEQASNGAVRYPTGSSRQTGRPSVLRHS